MTKKQREQAKRKENLAKYTTGLLTQFCEKNEDLTEDELKFLTYGCLTSKIKSYREMEIYLRNFRSLSRTDEEKREAGMTDEEVEKERDTRDALLKAIANIKLSV